MKLKEILGFKSLTLTSLPLQRSKRNIFPCGMEDTAKRIGGPPASERRLGGGQSQGEGERHGKAQTTGGCDCPYILNTSQST